MALPISPSRPSQLLRALPFLLGAVVPSAFAQSAEWTPAQVEVETALIAFLGLDAYQTTKLKEVPSYRETNPLLGKSPSDRKTIIYFSIVELAQFVVADSLPPPTRNWFLGGLLGLEVVVTGSNCRKERCVLVTTHYRF